METRKQTRLRWMVLLAVMSLMVVACGGQADEETTTTATSVPAGETTTLAGDSTTTTAAPEEPSAEGGTLIYGVSNDVQHFDPALLPAVNFPIMPQLFDSVIRLDESTAPQPALAESWELSSDGLSLTLNLRDDVVFHDGTPMTAEDIVWNIERYQNPDTGANARVMILAITSTEVVDDHTLVLNFDAPQAAIFDGLDLLYITKPTTDLESIRTNPVGTGPFSLVNHAPGDSITLEKNEAYWGEGLPKLDAVEIRILPDLLTAVVALETGEIDLLGTPPNDELDRLAEVDGIDVLQSNSPSVVYDVLFNVQSEGPFSDPLVRQAVHFAVNRDRIVDVAFAGRSEPWCLPWHSGSIAFTPAARDCPQDLDRARELMAEAGYADGFETSIMASGNEINQLISQMVASDLAEIGIVAAIDQVEVPQERWQSGDFEISLHGYGRANRDPASLLTTTAIWRPDNNFSLYESEEYRQLVTDIATTIDVEERRGLLAQLDELYLREMWLVSLAPTFLSYAFSTDVAGLKMNLDGMPFLESVTLSE